MSEGTIEWEIMEIIECCLNPEPEKRPSMAALRFCDFVNDESVVLTEGIIQEIRSYWGKFQ